MLRFAGGIATALQGHGLPPYTPVEPWLHEHPDRVHTALTDFRAAGCTHALTPSFMAAAQPDTLHTTLTAAVSAVRAAGLTPWGDTGPVAPEPPVYARWAATLVSLGVSDLTLETFTNGHDALMAVQVVRAVPGVEQLVISVVPRADGVALQDGTSIRHWAVDAVQAGASGVGVNCVPPGVALRSADALDGIAPLWVFPSGAPDWARAVRPLRERATWLGGCCGVDAATLADLWRDA